MGKLEGGYSDDDMSHDYVAWIVAYSPTNVYPIDDERALDLARKYPKLTWVESTHEQAYLIPLGPLENDSWGLEQELKSGSRWINSRIYVCEKPFDKPEHKTADWVLVGANFACEICEPEPGEEGTSGCTSCKGEGWTWLTVYDNDVREEIEEACEEYEVSLPAGFPSIQRLDT